MCRKVHVGPGATAWLNEHVLRCHHEAILLSLGLFRAMPVEFAKEWWIVRREPRCCLSPLLVSSARSAERYQAARLAFFVSALSV
jgi:hypothetical protein